MNSSDWFFEMFGWVFEMTPMDWVYLFFALVVARVVLGWLWQALFPNSYKAYKEKRRLAKAEKENNS
jgi:hypothetical protein